MVGNPPFLTQLSVDTARGDAVRRAVAERFGPVGTYTDTSALFLLVGLDLVVPDGLVALVQPQSVLAGKGAGMVRLQVVRPGRSVGALGD